MMKIGGKLFSIIFNWASIPLVSKSMASPTRWPPLPKACSEMPTVIKIWHLSWAPNLLLISPCWNVSQLWEDVKMLFALCPSEKHSTGKIDGCYPENYIFLHLNYTTSSLLSFPESVCLISPKRISIHSLHTFCFYKPQEK